MEILLRELGNMHSSDSKITKNSFLGIILDYATEKSLN